MRDCGRVGDRVWPCAPYWLVSQDIHIITGVHTYVRTVA